MSQPDLSPLTVADYQGFLERHGFTLASDGLWGPKTQGAHEAFTQRILPAMPEADAASFIAEQEGFDIPPDVPSEESGITVGVGYDLSAVTRQQVIRDWAAYLNPAKVYALQSVVGLTGAAAKARLPEVRRTVDITKPAAIAEFHDQELPRIVNATYAFCPHAGSLPPDAQSALMSLVYNRGTATRGAGRSGMARLRSLVAQGAFFALAKEIYAMAPLWAVGGLLNRFKDHALESDMWDRRHAEGDLMVVAGLRTTLNKTNL